MSSTKIQNAWCLYDWANSAYLLVITSTLFPIYYNNITRDVFESNTVVFFGLEIENTVLYSYSLSFSFLIVALFSPLLAGIADFKSYKNKFLKYFTLLGSCTTAGLYFFDGANLELGIILSILASIGYSGSLVFYNAFIPEIATSDNFDNLSARGYAFGYIGSVLLLIFSLYSVENYSFFGFESESEAVRTSFLIVGVWWFGFAQISIHFLPEKINNSNDTQNIFVKGYLEFKKVFNDVKQNSVIKRFLIAFLFYSTGVQTVMFLAATFGDKELQLDASKLIITVLIIQIVAIFGAYLFAWVAKKVGNKISITTMLVIWIFACTYAYFVYTVNQFYMLAFIVGLVMGGIQSISRSTYSKLIPTNSIDKTSYYSFYDVVEKSSLILGSFSYGLIEQITGSMRNGIIALVVYFIIGLLFLLYSGLDNKKLDISSQ
jgi:UMF1 family MFS transporter